MNRIVTTNTQGLNDATLPPRQRDSRLRLLIITMKYTGLRSLGQEFEKYTAQADDVDAVSILFHPPLWLKLYTFSPAWARPLDQWHRRMISGWRACIRSWFQGPLSPERFDAVHCTAQWVASFALRDPRFDKLTVSLGMDSTSYNAIDDLGDTRFHYGPLLRTEKQLYDRADILAPTSIWAADSLVSRYGVQREKILITPPTSDMNPRAAISQPFDRTKLFRILFIGNDFVRKGGDRLLRWHQQHWSDLAELHIASRDLEPGAAMGRNVFAHGQVPRQKLVEELLPTADLFVMPTRREMSCWPAVECQGAGVPVVLPRIAGIPDLVQHGKSGYLVPVEDDAAYVEAIDKLVKNPEHAREMGRYAAAFAREHFSREVVFGRLVEAMKRRGRVI
jgi:glycosyltransferase involved in cell wall biosynthesis